MFNDSKLGWVAATLAPPVAVADWENRGIQDAVAGAPLFGIRASDSTSLSCNLRIAGCGVVRSGGLQRGRQDGPRRRFLRRFRPHVDQRYVMAPSVHADPLRSRIPSWRPGRSGSENRKVAIFRRKSTRAAFALWYPRRGNRCVRITWPNGLIQARPIKS